MCLLKRKTEKYQIAEKDLYTYKQLNSDMTSPYLDFRYKYKKIYSIFTTPWWGYNRTELMRGFHSIADYYFCCGVKTVICRIPKGSKYYKGIEQDVISNKIEIIEPYESDVLKYIMEKYPDNNLISEMTKMRLENEKN